MSILFKYADHFRTGIINKQRILIVSLLIVAFCTSCRRHHQNAFYYWKADFKLSDDQRQLLEQANISNLYLRFFDIQWDTVHCEPFPNAIINFHDQLNGYHIIPVIYITNKTFEKISGNEVDDLAFKCNNLVNKLAQGHQIKYNDFQIDCDWTLATRGKYFKFLTTLARINKHPLQATIRLHQIKYPELAGMPPVSRGVLMFYNIGHLNAELKQPNSIYNYADAEKYLDKLSNYPIPLDIALPAFSWAIQVRNGRMMQIYEKVNRVFLNSPQFNPIKGTNSFIAKYSFFWGGIYIKKNDIFKLEEADKEILIQAVKQLAPKLSGSTNRKIIFYELANIDLTQFDAEGITKVSDSF